MFTWDNPNETARWRHMEQLEQIYMLQPLWVGDLISKDMTRCLRDAGLVVEDDKGYYSTTDDGNSIMSLWAKVVPGHGFAA